MKATHQGLLATTSAAVGAFAACLAVIASPATDLIASEERSPFPSAFLSSAWAGTVATLTALATIGLVSAIPRRRIAAAVGIVGSLILAAPALIDVSTALSVTLAGLGAGLILSASVAIAHGRRSAFAGLVVGAVSAFRFSDLVAKQYPDRFRWSISLPGDTFYPEPVVPLSVLIVATVLFAGSISLPHKQFGVRRETLVGITVMAMVVCCGYVLFGNMTSTPVPWTIAVAVTVVAIVGIAIRFGQDGAFLIAALAVAATSVGTMKWNAWWLVALAVTGFGVGALCAWRVPSVTAGCGILAVVCASGLLPDDPVSTVAYAIVLPAAAVYALLSCMPTDPAVMAAGVVLPAMLAVFTMSAYWIGGYELVWLPIAPDDVEPDLVMDHGSVGAAVPTGIIVALCAALIAAGAAAFVSRRSARSMLV